MPMYFIFLGAVVNGIVLFIIFSGCSLLVYEITNDFWVLILCPTTLLTSFVALQVFLWVLWDFLNIGSCHLWIEVVLLLPLLSGHILSLFIAYLLWLELLVQCCVAGVKVGILVLYSILRGKHAVFHYWKTIECDVSYSKCSLSCWESYFLLPVFSVGFFFF